MELDKKLAELIEARGVPGAQLAVMDGDSITEAAAGVLSVRTQCPATPDALFLPGSIGKLYTATLVMMLAEQGRLDLDAPVRTYLVDLEVREAQARDSVTCRNLLTHTSGFDGDYFVDTGRGDDALAKYVTGCKDLPQIAPPGLIWSYSNSGYAILGRVVEVLMETSFEQALREKIFEPLELAHTVSFADEAIVHPVAVGHVNDPEDPSRLIVSPTWGLYRAFGPMGSAVVASAGDVLRFVQEHLPGSQGRLIRPDTAAAMRRRQISLVDDSFIGDAWGLGWLMDNWGGTEIIGHDGNSLGQNAFMRIAPDQRFGFCLQTNVETAMTLYRDVAEWLFGEKLGVAPRAEPAPVPPRPDTDPARYCGVYEREGLRITVCTSSGGLAATIVASHAVAEEQGLPPMEDLPLEPVDRPDSFLLKLPIADAPLLAVFFDPSEPGGKPTYVHFGGRAARRVS